MGIRPGCGPVTIHAISDGAVPSFFPLTSNTRRSSLLSPPSLTMASTRKRKRPYFQSNTSIPAARDEVVTRVEITRNQNRRIRTTSTKISIPVAHVPSQQHSPLQTPEPLPSTCEPTLGNPSGTVPKKTRKVPTRSITVCTSPPTLSFRCN